MMRCGKNLVCTKLFTSCLIIVAIDCLMIDGYLALFVEDHANLHHSTGATRTGSLQARSQNSNPSGNIGQSARLEKSHVPRSTLDDVSMSCESRAAAAGFLFADSSDRKLNMNDAIDRNLLEILNRNGPDMRASRNNNDFTDITLNVSIRAWDLMYEHAALAIEQKVAAAFPIFEQLLEEAKTGKKCVKALSETMKGAQRLESWAVRLLNSWGSFPMSGLFDGTYGDVGSYDSCVDIKGNKFVDHAHYCTVTFRPVMPSLKDYELIVRKEPKLLRHHFERLSHLHDDKNHDWPSLKHNQERDAFSDLLENAQYHHYVYYKLGTCWPIACSPFEVKRLAKLIGRKSTLMTGPVKCFSVNQTDYEHPDDLEDQTISRGANTTTIEGKKLIISTYDENGGIYVWKPHYYLGHKIALWILGIITAFIVFMTFVDICVNRIPPLYRLVSMSAKGLPVEHMTNGKPNHQRRHLASVSSKTRTATSTHGHDATATTITTTDPSQQPLTQASDQAVQPIRLGFSMVVCDETAGEVENDQEGPADWIVREQRSGLFMSVVDDFSICTNVPQFFKVSASQLRTDILCLNGIRCITMVWIVMTHTMMYNDWAQFSRTKSIEISLHSIVNQPLFNGSYLVDTFFLMSGLLSAFTAFRHCQGIRSKFNSFAYIFGRWLRLTPQILFVSLLFIIVPLLSSGPQWYFMVGEYSENCMKNWWINMLHLQSFYKKVEMCNYVTWWISIDFLYHFFALAIIWVIMLVGHRAGFLSIMTLLVASVGYQSYRHYTLGLPPNMLSTIPQTGAMWGTMTLEFFWVPYTHAVPFFFGFYIGYLMALKKKVIMAKLNTRRALIGWTLTTSLLVGQSFSTYWWVTGQASYSKAVSTTFFGVCSIIWAGSICWIIIACQHGYGGVVNRFLSSKVFIVLGKASYLVYLTHFQILFLFFGNQNTLLEPSPINMVYIVLGNTTLSTIYGIFLCSVYELPWLKMHRRLMKYV